MRSFKNPEKQELFDLWLSAIFDHADSHVDWRWENELEVKVPLDDDTTLVFMRHLFEHSADLLETNSDKQVGMGIKYVCDNNFTGYMSLVAETKLPLEQRLIVVKSLFDLFQNLFETRCEPALCHLDQSRNENNAACYMFWEFCPAGFPLFNDDCDPRYADTVLTLMEKCLRLENPACVESALHGLGHLVHYNDSAGKIIEDFIRRNRKADPAILDYAEAAKVGGIN